MVEHTPVRAALYGGDDVTDLDAFDALDSLGLDHVVKVGVRSDEGPAAIVERADLVVDGVARLRRRPVGSVRFTDFLRTAVLLFGGAGTALAVVAIASASADDDTVAHRRGGRLVGAGRGRRAVAGPADGAHARASSGCWPAPARPTPCPRSSPARCCSTASGRSRCSRWCAAPSRSSSRRSPRSPPAMRSAWRSPGGRQSIGGAGDRGSRRRALLPRPHLALRRAEADPHPLGAQGRGAPGSSACAASAAASTCACSPRRPS